MHSSAVRPGEPANEGRGDRGSHWPLTLVPLTIFVCMVSSFACAVAAYPVWKCAQARAKTALARTREHGQTLAAAARLPLAQVAVSPQLPPSERPRSLT
jgi:hypothetical protein